ncbi:MAG: hypothetical protein AAF492_04000, partial [Verrucomicrobiota bacterium]
RTAAPVSCDADLNDWPLEGGFSSLTAEPYGEDHHLEAYLMLDDEHLYLAAFVGDPTPMRNSVDVQFDADIADKGGSIRVGLARAGGDPIRATLWYQPSDRKALLRINDTMAETYEGQFRAFANGRGYMVEYAIPWATLGLSAPGSGETMGMTWEVNWSDEGGRQWRGRLSDLITPEAAARLKKTPFRPMNEPDAWGKAHIE